MRIYFDNCCYNRPFDEQSQQRTHDETEAIFSIINRSRKSGDVILGSEILILEMAKIRNANKQRKVVTMYSQIVSENIAITKEISDYAKEIMNQSTIHEMDALHLSCAINGNADIFLTVDDRLIRACRNLRLAIRVLNPVSYLAEVFENVGD